MKRIDNCFKLLFMFALFFGSGQCRTALANAPSLSFTEVVAGSFVHFGKHEAMSVSNGGNIANIGFIIGETSIAVIDPGGSPRIGASMREHIHAVSPLPISHVILTHIHPDHVFGGNAFADVPHVIAHKHFTRAAIQRADFYRNAFAGLFTSPEQITTLVPTETNFDRLTIDLGNRILTVRQHDTGHSDNDVSVFDEKTKTLWASDLVFTHRLPSLDGSLPGWIGVLEELSDVAPDLVIPGHGPAGNWHEAVEPQLRYLRKMLRQTRAAIRDNTRLREAIEQVATDERNQWRLFDRQHKSNVTKAFTELEWE